jgi:DNA primase
MPIIKASSIRELKDRINLLDVISPVVTLRRAGNRFVGLCPFHQEKTPSFHVSPDRGLYKCFGCGKAGDALRFVMETEHLGFTEAAEALASRFRVTLAYEAGGPSREERSLRQELYDLHELAADHFRQALLARDTTGAFMRDYWTERRRFPAELAEEFRIGAADPAGSGLAAALLRRRFSEAALRQCGLFFVRDGAALTEATLRPRFRGRLMIPIRDIQGRVVAFTARQTDLTPADDPAREAKYVNSPETPIFTKGDLLFNLDRARAHSGEQPFVMVEGQLDALRCWHAGLRTVVAPQGTAITERQLAMLRRLDPRLECLLDGDQAGRAAAFRLIPLVFRTGIEATFLSLPPGQDPDELVRDGGLAAFQALRASAQSAIRFACEVMLAEPSTASAEVRARATEQLFALVHEAGSAVLREGLLEEAARVWRISRGTLVRDFGDFVGRRARQDVVRAHVAAVAADRSEPGGATGGSTATAAPAVPPEEHLLLLLLHHPELGPALSSLLHHEWIDVSTPAGRMLDRVLAEFEHETWPGSEHIEELAQDDAERMLLDSLRFEPPHTDDPLKAANEGLRAIHQRHYSRKLQEIGLEIARKALDGDSADLFLLRSKSELRRQLLKPPQLPISR